MSLDSSDTIAIAAVLIAIVTTVTQMIYERKREWHNVCEVLIRSLSSIYDEVRLLVDNPHEANHISFQFCLKQRSILLKHFQSRFVLKRWRIKNAKKNITDKLMELPIKPAYEEVIIKGKISGSDIHVNFLNEVRGFTVKATECLIK